MNSEKTPGRILPDSAVYPFDLPPEKLRARLCITEVLYNCAIALNSFLTVFLQQLGVTPAALIFALSFPIGHKLLGKSYPKATAYRG